MKDFIKKSVLFGVGVYSKAQKELDKNIKSLIKKNKITKKEGEAMLSKFIENSKKTEAKLQAQIKKEAVCFAKKVALAKQKDLLSLEKRVKKLEARLKTKTAAKKRNNKK